MIPVGPPDACDYVNSHGMVLCVATGNKGGDLRSPAIHSADFASVIAVGATDDTDSAADETLTAVPVLPASMQLRPGITLPEREGPVRA